MASNHPQTQSFFRRMWRKHLIMPAEHGSWPWLLVPFGVGALVAKSGSLAVWLTLLGGMSLFLMRQPASVWVRIRQGRGRSSDKPLARAWIIILLTMGFVSLLGLILTGRQMLFWLLLPTSGILGVYMWAAKQGRGAERVLWMELAGAVALAGMAPAAFIAATAQITNTAWVLWIIMATQNVVGVIYVRLRVADRKKRPYHRNSVIWVHAGGFLLTLLLGISNLAPIFIFVPFALVLMRAIWAASKPHPMPNVKRFGFAEIGVELLSGLWIVFAYILNGYNG